MVTSDSDVSDYVRIVMIVIVMVVTSDSDVSEKC